MVVIQRKININNLLPQAFIITQTRDFIRIIGKYYKSLSCDSFIGGQPLSLNKKY